MSELFKWLQKLPPWLSVVVLILATLFLVISKWEKIVGFIKLLSGRGIEKKRTCGDCVLILFGIREKYEYKIRQLDTNLLRSQMRFAEQKLQEIIFFLIQSFNEDIDILGKDRAHPEKVREIALYCEALKNSMLTVKDEVRRCFKENGFSKYSEREFTIYVKERMASMISIARTYIQQYYVQDTSTIVSLRHRFKKLDEQHMGQIDTFVFEIFTTAKDLYVDSQDEKRNLEEALTEEIDFFVNSSNLNGFAKRKR